MKMLRALIATVAISMLSVTAADAQVQPLSASPRSL